MPTAKEKYDIMRKEHCEYVGQTNRTWVWDVHKNGRGEVLTGCFGLQPDCVSGKHLFDPELAWALCSLAGWGTCASYGGKDGNIRSYLVMQSEKRGWAVAIRELVDIETDLIDLIPEVADAET